MIMLDSRKPGGDSSIFGHVESLFGDRFFLYQKLIYTPCQTIEKMLIEGRNVELEKIWPGRLIDTLIFQYKIHFPQPFYDDIDKEDDDSQSTLSAVLNPFEQRHEESQTHVLDGLLRVKNAAVSDSMKEEWRTLKSLAADSPSQPVSFFDGAKEHRFADLFSHLYANHPAMRDVIDFLVDELLLSAHQDKPQPRPILMVGPPGVGKTYFATDLASQLKAPFVSLSLATADAPWSLTGNSSTWSKSSPSSLISKIASTNAQAGLLFIDEISASANDHNKNHPVLPTLLELLDPEQSSRFRDLFFDHPMDLSRWLKILSCNSIDNVDRAIIDRCQVIEVKRPTADQQLEIIQMMTAKLPVDFSIDALVELNRSTRSLRQVQADLRKLAAKAIRKGASKVNLIDAKRLQINQEFRP